MSADKVPNYIKRRQDRKNKEKEADRTERDAHERGNWSSKFNSLV
jgi:hypothetical protein